MKVFIQEYKDLAEFIYFLTGPLMLVGVIVAIVQLYFYNRDMKIRIERESLQLSLATLERKFTEIDTAQAEAFECEADAEIPSFEGDVKGFSRELIECENDWLEKMEEEDSAEFAYSMMLCLNHLETLSQYILSGICDERQCFELEGALFLSYVDGLKEFIAYFRTDDNPKLYENIVKLYGMWSLKVNEEQLIKQKLNIDKQLRKSQAYKQIKVIGK
ncbi:hypothetical protein [Vibrio alginolyticus]|uniref:DUF4760 domain-containing protein n=1 Tax=Vibrio alginolyticus TaxID=663 RepID=UPI003980226A